MIRVNRLLGIDEAEISIAYTRSAGPGGQNVNKVATKAALRWNVRESPALTEGQRARLLERLATRINRDGVLRIVSSRHRSQTANRRAVFERFTELLADALRPRTPRKKTRPSRASNERRLATKRLQGQRKRERSRRHHRDDD